MQPDIFIAHVRESDSRIQSVEQHLRESAELAGLFASSIGLPLCGKLLGLCHDLGKYSAEFKTYIRESAGLMGNQAKEAAKQKQGTIDHATAGAQRIWNGLPVGKLTRPLAQILSVAVMSHHSRNGMKDFIALDGSSPFLKRLARGENKTHIREAVENAAPAIIGEIDNILISPDLIQEFRTRAVQIEKAVKGGTLRIFSYGLLVRFLFSCLLDADRLNTADFENRRAARFRTTGRTPDWQSLVDRFERHLEGFTDESEINQIRNRISIECREAASRSEPLLTLSVPTGGGKTLASLRFALHRATQAKADRVDRIIYILPYTSIIDQNAGEVRDILGRKNVLEHHSNLVPEIDTWRNRVLSENWDAPVVFTTSVQLLDALFAQSTGSARRMHQLANAILIFDEIQTLPVKAIHLFNNAINFLTAHCHTTVLLCTATMPLLERVNPWLGALTLSPKNEIIGNKADLFRQLKRTKIIDRRRERKWSHKEVKNFAVECMEKHQSVLVVCNTKNSASRLFEALRKDTKASVVHLSTSMCPAHRRSKIEQIKASLDPLAANPIICVSTQLIEAGVDLDFGCVIRSLAGMDSLVQAGGRCNRHGKRPIGFVYILNFAEEKLGAALLEISDAQEVTSRLLDEFKSDPARFDDDLLSEKSMRQFYEYHFFRRAEEMLYPLEAGKGNPPIAAKTSILSLLSQNRPAVEAAKRKHFDEALSLPFRQAFSTATQAFRVIDAPTQGVIVPYKQGAQIIADLAAAFASKTYPLKDQVRLLKRAQQFTVNAFPNIIKKLSETGALREIQPGSELYYLDERYYHADLGVTLEALSEAHLLHAS